MNSIEIALYQVRTCKKSVGKIATGKRRKLDASLQNVTVGKYGKVEHAHNALEIFRVNVCKSAAHKITADKALVGKVNSRNCHSGNVQSHNGVMGLNIIENILLSLSRIWNVIKTVIF